MYTYVCMHAHTHTLLLNIPQLCAKQCSVIVTQYQVINVLYTSLTCHDHTQIQKEMSINVTVLVRMKKAATKTVNITLGVWVRWQSYF